MIRPSVDKNKQARAVPKKQKLYAAVDYLMNVGTRRYQYVHGSHFIYAQILPTMRGSTLFGLTR